MGQWRGCSWRLLGHCKVTKESAKKTNKWKEEEIAKRGAAGEDWEEESSFDDVDVDECQYGAATL